MVGTAPGCLAGRSSTIAPRPTVPIPFEANSTTGPAPGPAPTDADKARLFDRVLQDTSQGFWFVDLDGITTELNPAMAELLGRPRSDVIGRCAFDFVDGEDRLRMQREVAARRQGQRGSYTIGLTRPDGSRVDCLNTASPIADAQGHVVGSVGIWTNLSAHLEAEDALHVHQVVVNSTSDMISVIDDQEVYRMVNDAWCRGTGHSREQALGRTTRSMTPGVITPARRQAISDAIDAGRTTVIRAWVDLRGDGLRFMESTYFPFADRTSHRRRVVIVTRDITEQEQAREALIAGAEYLRGTLNATGDAIFATDATSPDEPVRFANEQLFRLYGFPAHWWPTPTLRQITEGIRPWHSDPDAEDRRVAAIVAGTAAPQDQVRLSDGRVLLRRYASVPLRTGGRLRVWSKRDITAEVRAVEAREAAATEQRAVLESFPGYIAVVSEDGCYRFVNERLALLMRRPLSEIIGHHAAGVLGPQRWLQVQAMIERVRQQGRAISEASYEREPGQGPIDLEVTHVAGPVLPDGQRTVYAFGVDITERKRAQQALTRALADAERANRAKSQFLSRMSHELRTPLNAVLGFGQLLHLQPLRDVQSQQVQEILRGGHHLLALINDLLDLSRVEAGELAVTCDSVDAEAAIDDALRLMQPLSAERTVTLAQLPAAQDPPTVWADPKRLRQVLLNLLSNAIKYNRPGGQVQVDTETLGDEVELRVRDDGPGLSAMQQQRLFRPFERLDAGQGEVDGTGIGLALCRSLVQAMGGRIGVHSKPGQGSTFWVRLRRAAPLSAAPTAAAAEAHDQPQRRPRALYIEDNPVNLMLMAAMLEDEFELETAAEPWAGLARAQAAPPDLILLDIQLPGMDGYEVLRHLRADARTRAVPVVAVSANAMPTDLAAGLRAGFDAYVTKPVDLAELLATVRQVLSGR